MSKESWTGKFLDPAKVASGELKICASCWDGRNRPVDLHGCESMMWSSLFPVFCDCPCRDWLHNHIDLDTIDLDHDLGLRDLTDPFAPNS